MMAIKPGVKLTDLCPQMALAYPMVQDVFRRVLGKPAYECTVTSANDSTHSANSLHYKGRALDFRTHDFYDVDKNVLKDAVKAALGTEFDVVLEDLDGPNEHLHLEFDPKG